MNSIRMNISSFVAGLLFAAGLGIAGMTQPQKIISFLDITGRWDPSLMFVMGGALAVHLISYRLITRRKSPLFDNSFHIPNRTDIDFKLIGGSALFGIGWGLSGYCPGPAVVALTAPGTLIFAFFLSMLGGMIIFERFKGRNANAPSQNR
jgi:uncharacterized protein